MIIRAAILDDEQAFCDALKTTLAAWGEASGIPADIRRYTSSEPFLIEAAETGFDVAFLDIRLAEDLSGLDVAAELRRSGQDTLIVLVSNETQHVQEAFDAQVFQYLFKPVQKWQIDKCMHRIVERLRSRQKKFYLFEAGRTSMRLPLKDILYFSSAGHRVQIHLRDAVMTERKLLKEIGADLPASFMRCSRSVVVNLDEVQRIEGGIVRLTSGESLRIGPKYLDAVRARWIELFA